MDRILLVLGHTPLWVFAVFAVLTIFGVQGLRPRSLPVWRVLIVPAAFILWGVISIVARSAPFAMIDWLATAAAGFALAWITTRLDRIAIDRARAHIGLPGTAVPLARNLAIFVTKYALTAAMAMAPALHASLVPWDIGVSGLSAGYFIGWLFRVGVKYRAGRQQQPAAAA